jgi:hypothetical protein
MLYAALAATYRARLCNEVASHAGRILHDTGSTLILFSILSMFDPMSELTGSGQQQDAGAPAPVHHHGGGGGGRSFAQDLHSVTIHARQRTFYIDLKQSGNGKFFKISEKSRGGQKTTIMFDSEDLDKFIEALNEMKTKM